MALDPVSENEMRTASLHLLHIARWASSLEWDSREFLSVDVREREIAIPQSISTGEPLVSNGSLGADIIRLSAGQGFAPHTHAGDHVLLVLAGRGTIAYDGQIIPTHAGEIFLIEGEVPHAVGAITDHVILAVGSPHRPIDALDRMTPVEYQSVSAEMGRLHCLICDQISMFPIVLHDLGCPHCPCVQCNPVAGR